jgi:5'-deoxynucleotidase YfbR-like HD superfamily hydrolase
MQRSFIFDGGYSTRFHTVDVHNRQDIASHSFGVAWYCEGLSGGEASKDLIMAALSHDLAEHIVGDVPSPAKRSLGLSKQFQTLEDKYLAENGLMKYFDNLSENDNRILKYADMLEGMTFCLRERRLGNRNVEVVYQRFSSYILELMRDPQCTITMSNLVIILENLNDQWKEATE